MPLDSRPPDPDSRLSHLVPSDGGSEGQGMESRMVDVSEKPATRREALARARVRFPAGTLEDILRDGGPKGPILEVARTAAVLAAKRTADWIPLCHPLGLDALTVAFSHEEDVLEIRCRALCTGRTGVEMEALVGASAAALTVYDMVKGAVRDASIERVELLEKQGGRSGHWIRDESSPPDPERSRGS